MEDWSLSSDMHGPPQNFWVCYNSIHATNSYIVEAHVKGDNWGKGTKWKLHFSFSLIYLDIYIFLHIRLFYEHQKASAKVLADEPFLFLLHKFQLIIIIISFFFLSESCLLKAQLLSPCSTVHWWMPFNLSPMFLSQSLS